jgi:hypothetical protein
MRSSITAKIAAAIAATMIAELSDKILDSFGLSKDDARLAREIIKTVAVTIAALLVESMLSRPDKAGIDILR